MTTTWLIRFALGMALLLAVSPPPATAQQADDDALDQLLKKLEDTPPPATGDAAKEPKPGEVKAEDKDLDSLLEKLGETKDAPETKKEAMPPGGAEGKPEPGQSPDRARPAEEATTLKGKEKALDEHLERLLGRKKKNPDEQQGGSQGGAGDDSPLGQAIKKMEEVERKLSQSDTGEGTRKTEGEIVKQLDEILEQIRQARGGGSGQGKKLVEIEQAGNQGNKAGSQPGQENGNDAQGVGPQMPKQPTVGEMLAKRKDTWGDLPPHLREEMENVFKEEMLPAKRDLIIRYYTSVAKKGRQSGGKE